MREIEEPIIRLSNSVKSRVTYGSYVLLIGAGCSTTSNCPTTAGLIEFLKPKSELNSEDSNNLTLKDLQADLGHRDFNIYLHEKFSESTPSVGYWFLAELIKKRYFKLILTTNYDSCLENTLSKTMNYDRFRVLIRGDVTDERIAELIDEPTPEIKIVKLHGDHQSKKMIVEPKRLWELKTELGNTIRQKIKERGIIICGHSLNDLPGQNVIPKDEKEQYWYINPYKLEANSITVAILNSLGVLEQKRLCEKWSNFDNIFSKLSLALGRLETDEISNLKNIFKMNIKDIRELSKIEIDQRTLDDRLSKFKSIISNKCTISNLVFIHDPDVPGGLEILKLLKNQHTNWLNDKNIYLIRIEGRGENISIRKAKDLLDEYENSVNKNDIKDRRFLLIDSVSFSGNTIKLCAERLMELFGPTAEIRVGVIFSSPPLEDIMSQNELISKAHFYKAKVLNTYQILFPWGWTPSTKEIVAKPHENPENIDKYIPHKLFSFFPRPWGNIFSINDNSFVSTKILYLNPREKTSRHKHYIRDEVFIILDEHMVLQVWDENILLRRGSTFRVPAGTEHRLIGLDIPCRVLEIAENYNSQIEDIERYEDIYNRKDKKGDV